jgi:amino acid transporter
MSEKDTQLKKGRLGVLGIVFFVVAASAPLVGMTGAVPVAIVAGNGAAASGTYVAVGLILLLFSVGYTRMSSQVTNAGAFFAYVGRGLGKHAGVASAFASLVGYVTIQLAIYGFFGGLLALQTGMLNWWAWALIGWVVVTGLSLLSVDVGAKVLGTLMVLELLSLIIMAVGILVKGGPEGMNFEASFSPANIFAGGFSGGAGIAIAFAFASFIGFEATAIYGEESKDPKRSVPRATYWAIGIITALFGLVSFAMVTGFGASKVIDKVLETSEGLANPAATVFTLAGEFVGPWLPEVMGWLVVSSLFAGLLAFQNAASRYFFALGRGGVLPKALGKTNPAGAPQNGVILTSAIAIVVIAGFAAAGLDGIGNLFFWMSAVTAVAIIFVEILVSIAIVAYFNKAKGANVWQGKIAPIAAAIGLALGEYLLMSRFNLLGSLAPTPERAGNAWDLSPLGWFLVLSPFIAAVIGYVVSTVNKNENSELVNDILS